MILDLGGRGAAQNLVAQLSFQIELWKRLGVREAL